MKFALVPKMLFQESALNVKMALTLRRTSSVWENRCDRLDLAYTAELWETLDNIKISR